MTRTNQNQMPAKKSARRTRSKTFKRCSRQGKPGCARKTKTCSYDKRRTPRCQPIRKSRAKRSSQKKMRRVSKSSPKHGIGGLMSSDELEESQNRTKCRGKESSTECPPWDCGSDDECTYDKKSKTCVPASADSIGKFMDGTKYLTFRSNKKPAFTFRIPINKDTLYGKYAGAIRWSPTTGKLHLCYGPLIKDKGAIRSDRPVLSMLVKDKVNKDLWMWFVNSGYALQKKRERESSEIVNDLFYADLYGLPGASYQLSYAEYLYIRKQMVNDGQGEISLATFLTRAPEKCPGFLNGVDCFKEATRGKANYEKILGDYDMSNVARGNKLPADLLCLNGKDENCNSDLKKSRKPSVHNELFANQALGLAQPQLFAQKEQQQSGLSSDVDRAVDRSEQSLPTRSTRRPVSPSSSSSDSD